MSLKIDHLVGIPFELGVRDCYALARDFYRDNFDLELTDYARPHDFAEKKLDIFGDLYRQEGFKLLDVHPRDQKIGDGLLLAVGSTFANHCAVYIGDNKILHQVHGRFSEVSFYKGLWRNSSIAVLRHPSVESRLASDVVKVDLLEHLSPVLRLRLKKALDDAGSGGKTDG